MCGSPATVDLQVCDPGLDASSRRKWLIYISRDPAGAPLDAQARGSILCAPANTPKADVNRRALAFSGPECLAAPIRRAGRARPIRRLSLIHLPVGTEAQKLDEIIIPPTIQPRRAAQPYARPETTSDLLFEDDFAVRVSTAHSDAYRARRCAVCGVGISPGAALRRAPATEPVRSG